MARGGKSYVLRNDDGTFSSPESFKPPPDDLDVWTFIQSRNAPPETVCFVEERDGRETTLGEVRVQVERLAAALTAHLGELGKDDVLAIFAPNATAWAIAAWATFAAGSILSLVNPTYTADELTYQLASVQKHYKLKAIFAHPSTVETALEAATKLNLPHDRIILIEGSAAGHEAVQTVPALSCMYADVQGVRRRCLAPGEARTTVALVTASSGTTGLPKIIAVSHYAITTNVLQFAQHGDGLLRPVQDRVLGLIPFYHAYGFVVGLHVSMFLSMPVCPILQYTPDAMCAAIANRRLSILYLVPPLLTMLVKNPIADQYDLSAIRVCMAGAAPIGKDLFSAFQRKYPRVVFGQGFGTSETYCMVFALPWNQQDPTPGASCGVLIPGIEIKVIDPESGRTLGYNERGELCIKSPANALGYIGNQTANASTFVDGFVHTGDEAYVDEQGHWFITDRLKELIKVKGLQVAPAELEDHLLSHKTVADVCVIGLPDDYAGEVPRAYVVLTPEASKVALDSAQEASRLRQDLVEHVKRHKAPSKQLKGGVVFVESVPKTPSGKLQRRFLRDRARQEMQAESKAKL